MRNRIRHNYPSLIQCLRAFHILCFSYLLFRCYCYNYYKTSMFTFATVTITIILLCYQILCCRYLLENIFWPPLRRINKFGLNTLPSKIVAIPYTCGLSVFDCFCRCIDWRLACISYWIDTLVLNWGKYLSLLCCITLSSSREKLTQAQEVVIGPSQREAEVVMRFCFWMCKLLMQRNVTLYCPLW